MAETQAQLNAQRKAQRKGGRYETTEVVSNTKSSYDLGVKSKPAHPVKLHEAGFAADRTRGASLPEKVDNPRRSGKKGSPNPHPALKNKARTIS